MILEDIVAAKKKRLAECKKKMPEAELKKQINCDRESISFYQALAKEELSIIGEFKKKSPSHGLMNNKLSLEERIRQYNTAVDAISCLTEEDFFEGSTSYFEQIRAISGLPMIRKDFIIDTYQIYEAKLMKADCVLLIAAILTDEQLKEFYQLAYSLGMDALVEVHDREEMQRAIALNPKIIGINNRNLKNFKVDLSQTKYLAGMVPRGTVLVSESGVSTDEDVIYLKKCGVQALLIGTVLMEADNPQELARHWKEDL